MAGVWLSVSCSLAALALPFAPACTFTPVEPGSGSEPAPACTEVGHDEDGDGLDDACDRCPLDAHPAAEDGGADGDGDGVGDACDPHPDRPIDALRTFYSFAGDGAAAPWRSESDRWTWREDELVFADTAPDEYQAIVDATSPGLTGSFVIVARLVIDAAPSGRGQLGIIANVFGPGMTGLICAVKRAEAETHVMIFNGSGEPPEMAQAPTPNPMTAGSRYRLQLTYDAVTRDATCRIDDGTTAAIRLARDLALGPLGSLGFEAVNIAARVEAAAIYGRLDENP